MRHYQHFGSLFLKNSQSVLSTLGLSVKKIKQLAKFLLDRRSRCSPQISSLFEDLCLSGLSVLCSLCRRIAVEMLAQRVSCMPGIFSFFVGGTFKLFALLSWEDRKECFAKLEKCTDGAGCTADTSVQFFKLAVLICLPVDTQVLFFAFCCGNWHKVDK